MKRLRKIMAVAVCVCMLLSAYAIVASAKLDIDGEGIPIQAEPYTGGDEGLVQAVPSTDGADTAVMEDTFVYAKIVDKATDDAPYVLIETTYEPIQQIQLHVKDAIILDNETGLALTLDDLKAGDEIVAYHSLIMTKSLPPITNCSAIVANLVEKHTPAKLLGVGELTKQDDGSAKFLSTDGGWMITVLKDAKITSLEGTDATIDDMASNRVFVWFDIAAMSYPAQSATDRVVIVTPGQQDSETEVSIDLTEFNVFEENGNLMIPLRHVFETLDFTITWNGEEQAVELDNGVVKTTVRIGEDSYFKASSRAIGLTAAIQYGAAPVLVNDRTYVPVQLLNLIYSDTEAYRVEDGVLTVICK